MTYTVNIASVTDRSYLLPFLVMLHSLRSSTDRKIALYLLHSKLSSDELHAAESVAKSLDVNIYAIPLPQMPFIFFATRKRNNLRSRRTMSPVAYAKAFVDGLLPKDVDRCLILDADMIVRDDIGQLFDASFSSPLAAVANLPRHHHHQFNSGMMVANLDQWRAMGVSQAAHHILFRYSDCLHSHDQHTLNLIFQGDWHRLPLRWNFMHDYMRRPERVYHYDQNEIQAASEDPAIVHFAVGSDKPWRPDCDHPHLSLYLSHRSEVRAILEGINLHDPADEFQVHRGAPKRSPAIEFAAKVERRINAALDGE